jgi:hypothetical protein
VGLVDLPTKDEIVIFPMANQQYVVTLSIRGGYAIYTDDSSLLQSNNRAQERNFPWLDIVNLDSEEPVDVSFIGRGIRPYDTVSAKGRPVLYFDIDEPGDYEISHSAVGSDVILNIAPYYSEENENMKFWITAVQLIVVGLAIGIWYFRRFFKEKDAQRHKTEGADDMMNAIRDLDEK